MNTLSNWNPTPKKLPARLENIDEINGLWAFYSGNSCTVTVLQDIDNDNQYEMMFCNSFTDIPHEREYVSRDNLEAKMREFQSDLRKWRKYDYDEVMYGKS